MFPAFIASAPGKVILSGEHAVVHGTQAVATVVGMRAYAQFSPNPDAQEITFRIDYKDSAVRRSWKLDDIIELRKKALNKFDLPENTNLVHADSQTQAIPTHELNSLIDSFQTLSSNVQPIRTDRSFKSASAEMKFHEFEELDPEFAKQLDQAPAHLLLMMSALMMQQPIPLQISIFSNLPMGSGLGSSAALSASMAAGFYALTRHQLSQSSQDASSVSHDLTHQDRELINRWAFQGERLIHGNPSGVDNTCSVFGGVVLYRRVFSGEKVTNEISFLPAGCIPKSLQLMITDTRVPKDTKALVAKVGRLKDAQPVVMKHLLAAFDAIADQLAGAMKTYMSRDKDETNPEHDQELENAAASRFFTTVTQLFPVNQNLLNAVGVGHPTLDQVMAVSQKLSLPSKLTGAGGGGCAITVIPRQGSGAARLVSGDTDRDLAASFESLIEDHGFMCLKTVMGQEGVQISSVTQ